MAERHSQTAAHWFGSPSCCAVLPVVAVGVMLMTGCKTTPKPTESHCVGVSLVSQNGVGLYENAKRRYGQVRARDLRGEALESEMNDVLKLLDGAVANDPRCVLFHSKMAQMYLESGQVNRAYAGYDKARRLCQDWVPAWVGLADVAARKGEFSAARSHLRSAQKALDKIQGNTKSKPRPPDFFDMLGLNIPRKPEPGRNPNDPSLTEDERLRLIVVWLQDAEAWTIENPGLVMQQANRTFVNHAGLMRRLRADIEYHHALLDQAEGKSSAEVVKRLDYSLQWDPDFFPAKIEMASLMYKQGQYQSAERILKPYVDSEDPKLSNNVVLLLEMASVYTDWYKQSKETALADEADKYFDRLHKLNKSHAAGYVKRAELYLAAGTELKRIDSLKAGLDCLDAAKQALGGQDTDKMAELRKQLSDASQKIGS